MGIAETPPVASPWEARAWAIKHHFDGHTAMYDTICIASLAQFQIDVVAGDDVCRRGDRAELRRQAHSLKGVLLLLGATAAATSARTLELACIAGADSSALLALWQQLRRAVLALS